MSEIKVLIAGGGLGGLTLAQSLCQAGIDAHVFERDGGPLDRLQGYRLHLDADAISAAREVLAPERRAVFEATSFRTEPFTTILKTDFSVARRLEMHHDHGGEVWPALVGAPEHANVDRATLRQILLDGLEGRVHYGKTLERYESEGDRVVAWIADGEIVAGNVLVGADGIRSVVRHQRAPHARTVDAGITAIYGRVPLRTARGLAPREMLTDIFTIAIDERKVFLGGGAVEFPQAPDQAAAALAPGMKMRPQDDYVVCIVGGRHEHFPDLHGKSGADLQQAAADTIAGWPPAAAALIRAGDPSSFFLIDMYTSVPCDLDPPTNVTLLGDAIHAMTPTLGRGANVAMRDGALLGRALRAVAAGERTLAEALAAYERQMLDYGFAVVREAAEIGQQRMAQNPLPV